MVEELLAARGIIVSHETVRQWAGKFGQPFANRIRRRLPRIGDKWHLDEVVLKIAGVKHWLWRAVDQTGIVLDVLVQRRRDKQAAKRLLRKLLKKQMRPPRVMITDKLASYFPAQKACFPKAASESPAVHPTNDKTRRFVPGGKAPFELMSAGRDHSADCLVMAQLILTRLSAITPRPTQRCIPASPL
jgi:transposase-like protein